MAKQIKTLLSGGNVPPQETIVLGRDGSRRDVEVLPVFFIDQQGPAIHVMIHDITASKLAEKELHHQQRKLRELTYELQLAEERERNRIAGELHDHVAPNLLLGRLKINAFESLASKTERETLIGEIDGLLERSVKDIRSLTRQLRPSFLATAGLEAALKWLSKEYTQNFGLEVTVEDDGKPKPLRYEIRSMVFQVVRELLLNVVKHAGTDRADIVIRKETDSLILMVRDNGVGFDTAQVLDPDRIAHGVGLSSIQEKIAFVGGTLTFDSTPGNGTCVTLTVPCDRADDREEGLS